MKKIIILASEPRTGSNLLIEALNLYKPVRVFNEFYLTPGQFYFDENNVPTDLPHKMLIKETEREQLGNFLGVDKNDYFNMITQIRAKPIESLLKLHEIVDSTTVIKVHGFHFEELDLINKGLFDIPNVEVILLERTSRIHSYVSKLKARQFDKWHNVDTSDIKVHVDPVAFVQEEQQSLNWYKYLRSQLSLKNKNQLEVNYERHLEYLNKDEFYNLFDAWFNAVGINLEKSQYELKYFKKQNNAPIENSIENFEQVKGLIFDK